ncbi:carboxylesterase 3-like [Mizuhopecten yessoensis]|uniref:Carboxylic ester hydrolase n=1 Tax=Mizuhopecten yessoensis TaxID=6573 RepID=A0A210Q8V2_MIZYE|nr:carboxylesterase 3-like [Mizuhopecten yessoensis]OWF45151.1 Carboxylesterase 3 [Mizuhopecten yessoensis]
MMQTLCVAVWLTKSLVVCTGHSGPVVNTPSGPIQGVVVPALGQNVLQFRNIPFAEPPVGELRFEKPVPVGPWTDTLDGTKFGPSCIQDTNFLPEVRENLDNKETSEDCLQLNVYVPEAVSTTVKKPVMVYIHGGGFASGYAALYDSSYFALKDVIVVTLQYRLGLFGFLSTGDSTLPGNYGLWDMIEALRWVNKNIASFGGDPHMVTIVGESAGGFAVSFLSVSPTTKGLFQRVVAQSGTPVSKLFISENPIRVAEKVGSYAGCITDTESVIDNEALIKCLKGKSAEDLLKAQSDPTTLYFGRFSISVNLWPVIDGELLLRKPIDSLQDPGSEELLYLQSLDLIAGTNDNEASLIPFIFSHFQEPMNFSLSDGIPTPLLCDVFAPAVAKDAFDDETIVSDMLCQRYKEDNMFDQAQSISDLYGDLFFHAPTVALLDFHSKGNTRSNTYQYLFTHEITFKFLVPSFPWSKGAGHGVECLYMFGPGDIGAIDDSIRSTEGRALTDTVVTYLTNFAKTGNPNGQGLVPWEKFTTRGRYYLDINYKPVLRQDLYQKRITFLQQDIPNQLRQSSKTEL